MPRAIIIYNPNAGPDDMASILQQVAAEWRSAGWQMAIWPTKHAGHGIELARTAAAEGTAVVLAAGGDGTLGEVSAGLAGTDTAMGPLPAGTANSFARELLMPRPNVLAPNRLVDASRSLLAGQIHRMDLGYTYTPGDPQNGRYWLLWSGVGVDSYLVDQLEPRPKWAKRVGRASYVVQGAPFVLNYSHFHGRVDIDGERYEDDFVLALVSNCRRYAGGLLTISPNAALDDGLFEVYLFKGKGIPAMSMHAALAFLHEYSHHDIVAVTGRSVTIHTADPLPYHTDGEPVGQTPAVCEMRAGALRLLVPDTAPEDLFKQPGVPLSQLRNPA